MPDPETPQHTPDPSLGQKPELAKKIAKVMGDIDEVPKTGYNDYHGYNYATDDDVMGEVRPAMSEHNLIALPSLVDRSVQRFGNEKEGYTLHTRITLEVTFIDGDSGQQHTITWEGEAQDTQDKGLYKAYTSAIKYCMLKAFLLSADTDVETDDIAGKQRASSAPKGQSNGKAREPTASQVEYAEDLAAKDVWSDGEKKELKQRIQSSSRSELSDLIDNMKQTVEEREASGKAQGGSQTKKSNGSSKRSRGSDSETSKQRSPTSQPDEEFPDEESEELPFNQ